MGAFQGQIAEFDTANVQDDFGSKLEPSEGTYFGKIIKSEIKPDFFDKERNKISLQLMYENNGGVVDRNGKAVDANLAFADIDFPNPGDEAKTNNFGDNMLEAANKSCKISFSMLGYDTKTAGAFTAETLDRILSNSELEGMQVQWDIKQSISKKDPNVTYFNVKKLKVQKAA